MNTVKMQDRNGGTDFMVRVPKIKMLDKLEACAYKFLQYLHICVHKENRPRC